MSQEAQNKYFTDAIEKLGDHAQKANEEMGLVQIDIAILKTDVAYIKGDIGEMKPLMTQIHSRQNYWMGGIAIITLLMPFVFALVMKFI